MPNYKKISDRIEEIEFANPRAKSRLKWVNVVSAGKTEASYLRRKYKFDLAHLKASVVSVSAQRPIIYQGSDYLFLILHFPTFKDGRIVAGEIDFFVGHGYLVTVHSNGLKVLNRTFDLGKKSPETFLSYSSASSAVLLYEVLDQLIDDCYNLIDQNSLAINEVEELIFSGEQVEAVKLILDLRRNIVNIRRIFQNHKNILKKLNSMKSSIVKQSEIKKYYDSLVEHSKRIWEMLDNQKEMIEVLNNTNESLLNDRMSDIMKTLTIFSVIVFPLTLLAAIFGMNTPNMPLIHHPYGFWILIGAMVLGCLGMLLFFKKKKWM